MLCASAGAADAVNKATRATTVRNSLVRMGQPPQSGECPYSLLEEAAHGVEVVGDWRRRQRGQKPPSIAHGFEPRVEDREDAPVASMTNQAAESLLQRQDREGHLVVCERIA